MAAMFGLPISVPEIGIAALAAALLVLGVWFEVWHRQEQRRIAEYRARLKGRLDRRDADHAYKCELAVRPVATLERQEGNAAA